MKKIIILLAALVLTIAAEAQYLNITTGSGTKTYSAADLTSSSPVTFANGTSMTVGSDTYTIGNITHATVTTTNSSGSGEGSTSSDVANNTVNIVYNGSSATVTMAENVASYVTATVSGAHVTIAQSNTDAVDNDEITYVLSGSTTDGSLTMSGSYKCTVSLAGVTLTNPSGAAINIGNKKRIQISAKNGTTNTLADCANGSQKGCIYSKGQIQLQGNGTLNVYGYTKHAIKSGDYISIKNLTLNILNAVGDGINANKYFLMKSGTVTISGVGDDGIQSDYESDDATTGETTDHEDENSANTYIEGGTLNVTVTADAAKGVKAAGDLNISGGTITVNALGKYAWDSDDSEYKSASCLNCDGNMTISGGTITCTATGYAGKGIKCDGVLTVTDGTVSATASGSSSDTYGSAKAIKAGTKTAVSSVRLFGPNGGGQPGGGSSSGNYTYSGGMVISGGSIYAKASSHEAIESKNTLDISGGNIYAESSDDAINAASTLTITGGNVYAYSTGNDGMDANGDFKIQGGNVVAIGSGSPEVAIDANTEGGYKLYITGGNVVAVGGLESGSSLSGVTSKSVSYSSNTWYTFKNGSTSVFSFKIPTVSTGGGGGWGHGGGSSSSSMTIVATGTPSVSSGSISGTTIWNGYGIVN